MRVIGIDAGFSTGYTVLDVDPLKIHFEQIIGGTINLFEDVTPYDYLRDVIINNNVDCIVCEFPVDSESNPMRKELALIRETLFTLLSSIKPIREVKPSQWKTSPSSKFVIDAWNKQTTKHQKDSARIAHYFTKFLQK